MDIQHPTFDLPLCSVGCVRQDIEKAVSGYVLKIVLRFEFRAWKNSNNDRHFSMCNDGGKDFLVVINDINVILYIGDQRTPLTKDQVASYRYGSLNNIYPTHEQNQKEDIVLEIPLAAESLVEIETIRKGGDARFSLTLSGMCSDYCGDAPPCDNKQLRRLLSREQLRINDRLSFTVPQSDWVKLLEKSNFGLYILLESPIISRDADGSYMDVIELLKKSRDHLRSGNYSESVEKCREVIESVVNSKASYSFAKNIKALSLGGDVSKNLKANNLKERFELVLNSTMNVAHLSAHAGGEKFSYESASAVLIMTSSIVSLAMHGYLPERKQNIQESS
jgi:hypothetical protein